MVDSLVTAAAPPPTSALDAQPVAWPAGELLRDVARGGLAGIIVGLLVAGLGGRLVMRLATILHEDRVGFFTENGERIGVISFNGTMALMVFGGLGMGLLAGTMWVIASPWIPGRGLARASVTALAAIALGTPPLIQRTNSDFEVLRHDPVVIALLVGLVGLVGLSIALVDGALDARLPHPRGAIRASTAAYLVVTLLGVLLILPLAIALLLDHPDYRAPIRAGWALAVTGACTLTWWVLRARGRSAPPTALRLGASVSLVVACVLGVVTALPHVLGAAGIR